MSETNRGRGFSKRRHTHASLFPVSSRSDSSALHHTATSGPPPPAAKDPGHKFARIHRPRSTPNHRPKKSISFEAMRSEQGRRPDRILAVFGSRAPAYPMETIIRAARCIVATKRPESVNCPSKTATGGRASSTKKAY